jgi:putative aminopeptidase FrvX
MKDITLLKEVLSVPTKTYQEHLMVDFLVNWLTENEIEHYVDNKMNIYATKKETSDLPEDFFFPCVISHTDTVHHLDTINIEEMMLKNSQGELKPSLKAFNNDGFPTGIGGDDKCGVFACLTLLKELPYLKAAFFVAEETGCHGSNAADKNFFENVGYGIQFDAPENWMITEKCFGQLLFDRGTEFFEKIDKVLTEGMINEQMQYMVHPYTDVYALRTKFNFACINFSIGYYDYHTRDEYVVIEDVFNGIEMGRKMINELGYKLHYKKSVPKGYFHPF